MEILRGKNLVWALLAFLLAGRLAGQANLVAPPKDEAGIRKMMSVTHDLHILPAGAKPDMLEHLLELGEVVVYYDHGMAIPWMTAAGVLVDAPADQVFAALTDYAHYPEFVPGTESASSKKISKDFLRVDFQLKVEMFFLSYRLDYAVYHWWRPPYRIDWSHAEGEFGKNCGFAELIPSADGKRTMFFYAVYSEPKSKFLSSLYAREPSLEMMTSLTTATMFAQAVKSESEKRFAQAGNKTVSAGKPREIFEVLGEDPEGMRKILELGNLLVLEDGPTVNVVSGGLVAAPISKAYSVIADFKKYPDFVPGAKKVTSLGPTPAGDSYQWEAEFNLAFFRYAYTHQLSYSYQPPELIAWQIPRPCCGPAPGFWKLIPAGDRTMIFNSSTGDIRSLGYIPRYALKEMPTLEYAALASQALVVINAMKQRIQKP